MSERYHDSLVEVGRRHQAALEAQSVATYREAADLRKEACGAKRETVKHQAKILDRLRPSWDSGDSATRKFHRELSDTVRLSIEEYRTGPVLREYILSKQADLTETAIVLVLYREKNRIPAAELEISEPDTDGQMKLKGVATIPDANLENWVQSILE